MGVQFTKDDKGNEAGREEVKLNEKKHNQMQTQFRSSILPYSKMHDFDSNGSVINLQLMGQRSSNRHFKESESSQKKGYPLHLSELKYV